MSITMNTKVNTTMTVDLSNIVTKGALLHFRGHLIKDLTDKMGELIFNRTLLIDALNLPRHMLNKEQSIAKYRSIIDDNKAHMFGLIRSATQCQILDGNEEQGKLDSWVRNITNETTKVPPISIFIRDEEYFNTFAEGLEDIFRNQYKAFYDSINPTEDVDDSLLLPETEVETTKRNIQ